MVSSFLTRITSIAAVAILLIISQLQAQKNLISTDEQTEGFKPLFNGRNLKGWHTYLREQPNPQWLVDSGSIHLKGSGGGDLVSNQGFTNFILRFEWKISAGGNSGVFYKVNETPQYKTPYLTGIEYQILDNQKHKDGALRTHRAGSAYDLFAPTDSSNPEPETWHSAEITVAGNEISHSLNGNKIVHFTLNAPDYVEKLKASKFAKWQGFASFATGRIALQDHGNPVWFKNLRIKQLK